MRRPLNGNGAPIVVNAAGDYEVFDPNAFDPNYTYAVTLYVWAASFAGQVSGVGTITGGTPQLLHQYDATALDSLREGGNGPVRVADRLVVRGDQQVVFGSVTYGGLNMWLYGYFERSGEASVKPEYRPLQPTNDLVSPYNAPITQVNTAAGGANQNAVLHQLYASEERSDLITLDIRAQVDAGNNTDGDASINIPGLATPIVLGLGNSGSFPPLRLFDGIPIRPTSSAAADSQISLDLVADSLQAATAVAVGRFTRQ